jgi:hypothetical protein
VTRLKRRAHNQPGIFKAIDVLRADSISIIDEDVAHLAPTLRAHINPYGK